MRSPIREVEDILRVTKETVYGYMDLLKIKWDKNQPRNKSLINSGDIPKLMDLARWSKENRGKYLGEYLVESPIDGISYCIVDKAIKKVGKRATIFYEYWEILNLPYIKRGKERLIKTSDVDLMCKLSKWNDENQGKPIEVFLRETNNLQEQIKID